MRHLTTILVALTLMSCAHLSSDDRSDLALYDVEQKACLAAHHGDGPSIDRCKADVRARWAAKWNAKFDGGFTP